MILLTDLDDFLLLLLSGAISLSFSSTNVAVVAEVLYLAWELVVATVDEHQCS